MSRLVVAIGHVEFTGGSQVLYVVKVQQDADEWEVRRTYSDFRKLRDDVLRVMKDTRSHILDDACSRDFASALQDVQFPSKRLFGSKKDHVVKERAVELHRFLIKLLFLTHTYRKAQKKRYDQYVQALPSHQQAAYAALQDRTQASVSVFHLIRDFLKPVTIKTDVAAHSGDLLGSGVNREDGEDSPSRLIRESKILAMRSSNPNEKKSKTTENKHKQVANPANEPSSTPKTVKMNNLVAASERTRTDANSLREQLLNKQETQDNRKQRHFSTPDGIDGDWKYRTARSATSATVASSPDDSEPEREKMIASSSVPSSATSEKSANEVKLVDLSSLDQYKTKKSSRRGSHTSDQSKSSHKSRSKEKSSSSRSKERSKRKTKSAKNMQLSDSERMSRVSSALNAQAIAINAQRELEKYVSEYSAIMVLRYVDRFVNKAVIKSPGCYRVNAQNRLVIDGQRFFHELEVTFSDLPSNFNEVFHIGAPGDHDEWGFPPGLDKYVQLKWSSFQAMVSASINHDNGHSSAADHTSDSDDSDTEYEYEEIGGGGLMTRKQSFSNDEESMLQEMIANGTAGREQMLRLRRHMNEQGWNRRVNPGSRSQRAIEEASSSGDSEEEETREQQREKRRSKRREPKRSVSVVEQYQQEQNARRQDRLGRVQSMNVQSIGGFV